MPLYLSQILGDGTQGNPFVPVGFDQLGAGWIDLRPDATVAAGSGLLYLPTAVADVRLVKFSDGPDETLGAAGQTLLQSGLGLVGVTRDRIDRTIFDLLTTFAGGARWKPLLATFNQWLIYLGAIRGRDASGTPLPFFQTPVLSGGSSFTETWPTNKTPLDSPSTGEDQVWTTETDTFKVTGLHLEPNSTLAVAALARCGTNLATAGHRHTADYVAVTDSLTTGGFCTLYVRKDSGGADTGYVTFVQRDKFAINSQIQKVVAGAATSLANSGTDPGTPGTAYCEVIGSSVKGQAGTDATLTATDTAITGNTLIGVKLATRLNTPDAQFDNHTFKDVSLAITSSLLLLGVS